MLGLTNAIWPCLTKDNKKAPQRALKNNTFRLKMLAAAQPECGLEIEIIDVARVEGGRRPKNNFAILADRPLAELAGVERFALLAGDRARHQVSRGISGQIAQLTRVPQ